MAATVVAARSTFLGPIRSTAIRNLKAPTRRISGVPNPNPSIRSNISSLGQNRVTVSPSRLVRRELSTLHPFYSATASACLVSKLSTDITASYEGRFANYLSPI